MSFDETSIDEYLHLVPGVRRVGMMLYIPTRDHVIDVLTKIPAEIADPYNFYIEDDVERMIADIEIFLLDQGSNED